jgi:HD-GYP domain-containing protein (c-di-GMP phosphodiesterase class II)
MVGSEVWGALHVVSDRPDAYDSDDLGLAEAIAEQIGRALATVWVIKRLEEARSKEVDWLATAVAPRWNSARRLADLAERVGRRLGLSDAEVRDLRMGGLFHDIGTIAVPSEVLYKRGRLTDEERAVMREHAVIGERVLRRVPHLRDAARIVRHSHERVDGAGYPDGLAGEQIPVASRVLLAVEAFVAMTSPRPYRDPMSREAAIAELRRAAGSQLDRDVVDALVAVAGE